MRAQLSLMDDRPDDCPPWYDTLLPSQEKGFTDKTPVLIAYFLLSPVANIPNVINMMATVPVVLDLVEMIVFPLVWMRPYPTLGNIY
jgi:hypothetical protein